MSKFQSKTYFIKRIIFSLLFIYSVFILPWWLVLVLGLGLSFYFQNFYEFIVVGLILDSLYGGIISIEKFYFFFTLITSIVTFFLINFKKKLLIR